MGSPTTNFLQHNPTAANQEADSTYVVDATRTGGLVTNQLVPSVWLNKILFQVSTFIAAFAQMMVNKGYTVLDSNLSTLATALANVVTLNDWTKGSTSYGFWEKSPSGKITQWGTIITSSSGHSVPVTFPTPFTNLASISIVVSPYMPASVSPNTKHMAEVDAGDSGSTPVSLTGFGVQSFDLGGSTVSDTVFWQAVGY